MNTNSGMKIVLLKMPVCTRGAKKWGAKYDTFAGPGSMFFISYMFYDIKD
jgi:hypothetical protein